MPELLKVHLLEVGKQPLPDIAIIDVRVFGRVPLFPSGYVRMSRPDFRALVQDTSDTWWEAMPQDIQLAKHPPEPMSYLRFGYGQMTTRLHSIRFLR